MRDCTVVTMASCEVDQTISYALHRLGCESLTLKSQQRKCVEYIYDGKDVFLWLPTGFGKSSCYEVLPFVFDMNLGRSDSAVIVMSLPVSLMLDQTRSLRSRGVKASIMSSTSEVEKELIASEKGILLHTSIPPLAHLDVKPANKMVCLRMSKICTNNYCTVSFYSVESFRWILQHFTVC